MLSPENEEKVFLQFQHLYLMFVLWHRDTVRVLDRD